MLFLFALNPFAPALAEQDTLGDAGIQAHRLHNSPYFLSGHKIALGQVEIGRPAKFSVDKLASWQPPIRLAGIFFRNQAAIANRHIDPHAAMVAAIMVGRYKRAPGIAPQARLHSAAVGDLKEAFQPEHCLTSQFIAQQNGGEMRGINLSFGDSLGRDARPDARLDGQGLFSQCIDWLAHRRDVLFVVAGNQGNGGIPIPTDNYNGITVAYSTQRQGTNYFNKVDYTNISGVSEGIGRRRIETEVNQDNRRTIGLIAPGAFVTVYDLKGKPKVVSGSSFAAPLVTGTIALLQEFGDRQFRQGRQDWSLASRRSEVMKAILLNSADKLEDTPNGDRLGMTRTIYTKKNQTWLESQAYHWPEIPLDGEMGSGQLNAWRALQQFQAGQWSTKSPIPAIGWNYNQLKADQVDDYSLDQPLAQSSFVSITLVWHRGVKLQDKNQNQEYDLGESFQSQPLNNLDLHLLSLDRSAPSNIICSSRSRVDNVEHIFCAVPQVGRYRIRVTAAPGAKITPQSYALSWWTVPSR